jgi:prepilin-type N-terminal cleavage/methylation domain-containing protein
MMKIGSQKGFTLGELMVVIMIIGVTAGLGIPMYTNTIERARAEAAVNQLYFIYRAEKKAFNDRGAYVSLSGSEWGTGDTADSPANRWLNNQPYYTYDFSASGASFTATASRIGKTKTFTINQLGTVSESGSY